MLVFLDTMSSNYYSSNGWNGNQANDWDTSNESNDNVTSQTHYKPRGRGGGRGRGFTQGVNRFEADRPRQNESFGNDQAEVVETIQVPRRMIGRLIGKLSFR